MATTPVFLLGKSHGHRSLVGSSPSGRKELGTTEWLILTYLNRIWSSQVALVVKNLTANAGDIRVMGLIPGSGRSPGGVHDNPLQYFCLENPMDRGAWWATVHKVAKSRTQLKRLTTQIGFSTIFQLWTLSGPKLKTLWYWSRRWMW